MNSELDMEMPFVTFTLDDTAFAVSTLHVQEMVTLPEIQPVPDTDDCMRGLMMLRDQAVPIIDLRLRLGLPSLDEELRDEGDQLAQRRQDHVNWIAELKASVQQKRPFTLATDPHQCAFGKWHDQFHSNSTTLSYYLDKFTEPHARIHAVACQVEELKGKERFEDALGVIASTEAVELQEMIHLFMGLDAVMKESLRETVLVLATDQGPGDQIGVCVDRVLDVSKLVPLGEAPGLRQMNYMSEHGLVVAVVRTASGGDDIIQVLDVDHILELSQPVAV